MVIGIIFTLFCNSFLESLLEMKRMLPSVHLLPLFLSSSIIFYGKARLPAHLGREG